jgi:hypothetical protein
MAFLEVLNRIELAQTSSRAREERAAGARVLPAAV